MSKHRFTTILISLVTAAASISLLMSFVQNRLSTTTLLITIPVIVLLGLLLYVHLQVPRWRWSAELLVSLLILVCLAAAFPSYMQNNFFLTIFVPTVVAAALLSPRWSLVTFAVTLAGSVLITGLRAQSFDPAVLGPTVRPDNLLTALVIAFGIAIAGWMAQSAQRTAEQNALRLVEERDRAELQSREIITANAQLNEQIDQQKQLLELVATLETSVVPLADGILFAPIVGHLDSRRAQAITTRLLEESNQQRARMVILDVGGVAVMDTAVAGALLNTARSLRLLGCEVTLSGISANVALTLTQLGIALEDIRTVRSPQEALTQVGQRVLNGKV